MQFDVILSNPPFQDSQSRNKTPHKLWIDFTLLSLGSLLKVNGSLVQVSPSSFASPSNKVLKLMTSLQTQVLRLGTESHFPGVGSSFSDYWIIKTPNDYRSTKVFLPDRQFDVELDPNIFYLPNDLGPESLSIHSKVIFRDQPRLKVEWDYVNAHNIRRFDQNPTLSETKTEKHIFPVFHTNRKTWWSSKRQDWANSKKVMWTRSGYTKPFFDPGKLGGTDMAYFVRVKTITDGTNLAHNLNLKLFRYVFATARWSGFGNEKIFCAMPAVPTDEQLDDAKLFDLFELSREERDYVSRFLGENTK